MPEITARAAHTAFLKGHRHLTIRDNLGTVFTDEMLAKFPATGRPAEAPWRLARVTIDEALKAKEVRPGQHFVDNNYVLSKLLVESTKDFGSR